MPTAEDPQDPAPDDTDPFEGLVLDADFIRGAQHKEGSARARMLAGKWKKHPPTDTSFRPAPAPRRRRRFRMAGKWQLPLFVVLAVALVLVGMNSGAVADWFNKHLGGRAGTSSAAPGASPTDLSQPSATPSAAVADDLSVPTVAHPFAGSPAVDWPTGAAGIRLPAAHSEGVFSSAQVSADLKQVRTFLTTAYLDPKILSGGSTAPVAAMLNSQQAKQFRTGIAEPSERNSISDWVSRFKPDYAVPATTAVKVKGTLKITSDGHNGLTVHADYIFVYATRPASDTAVGGSTPVDRTISRRILDFDFYDPARYVWEPGKLVIQNSDGDDGNSMCGVYNGYLNPYFNDLPGSATASAAPSASGTPSGPAIDPYDGTRSLAKDTKCGVDSRT